MYGTTKEFLDYFGLKRLEELPTLAEIRDLDSMNVELDLEPQLPENAVTSDDSEDDMDRKALHSEAE